MTPEELDEIREKIGAMAADLEAEGLVAATALADYLRDLSRTLDQCPTVADAVELLRSDLRLFTEFAQDVEKALVRFLEPE